MDIKAFQEYQENAVCFPLLTHCALKFSKKPGTTKLLSKTSGYDINQETICCAKAESLHGALELDYAL